ncbi:uncharacterized protein LOC125675481 [Ostrea edulis]|uniref:uncharacterized protein LOC125675481 n=1 Tax=Ostrea edulis TaxID=37623 RepID=UPI002095D4FA|nr:uncharacterized protein LOC125675481 [Ostrea edulis]
MEERPWDPFKTFNVSAAERDLIDRRRKTRDKFRAEYRKILSDPRTTTVMDQNFMRWYSLKNNQVQLFELTKRSFFLGLMFSFVPVTATFIYLNYAQKQKEEDIMSGKLTWRDRVRGINCLGTTT